MMKIVKTLFTGAVLGLSLLSTNALADSHGGMKTEGVMVHNPWVRAVPPTSKMSAAYMILKDNSGNGDKLLSAESDVAKNVELHNVRKKGDMMEMYQVESIQVPADGNQQLKPGSYHVMLIGLTRPLKMGDEVEVTLNFEKAGAVTVKAPVKEGGITMKKMQH